MENKEWLESLQDLERRIGYVFRDRQFLVTALTHSSFVKGAGANADYNERIEFLGDAVLELAVSERLYQEHPEMKEGEMTRLRARLVCEKALFRAAGAFGLAAFLRLGKGEEHSGGREKPSVVSDALESVIGAIYLDGGFPAAKAFVSEHVLDQLALEADAMEDKDYKTRLQEYVQKRHMGSISYELISAEGPDHDKVFTMGLFVDGKELGRGSGRTKQSAGQEAASQALKHLISREDSDAAQ